MLNDDFSSMLIKYHNFPNDYSKYESVQGGKMEHIFEYSKQDGNNLYNFDKFTSKLAEEAYKVGKWTIKFHGANGFITKENDILKIWERRDLGEKSIETLKDIEYLDIKSFITNPLYKKIILPEIYESNQKKHHYIFILVKENSKMGKKLYPRIKNLLKDFKTFCQSVEIVGKKIQGNPDQFIWKNKIDNSYGIVFHSSIETFLPNISYQKLKEIANTIKIEGWVIYHKGAAFKLRTNMILPEKDCAFNKKDKTDIQPIVY